MTRTWEFNDNRALPSDLVREQDFILRLRRLQRHGGAYYVVNLVLNSIENLVKHRQAMEMAEARLKDFAAMTNGTYADMSNGDVFIIWEDGSDAELLTQRLAKAILPDQNSDHVPHELIFAYKLPADYTKLRERANEYVEMIQTARASDTGPNNPADMLQTEAARGPLTAWSVDQIGRLIDDLSLQPYIRGQPIYRLQDDQKWTSESTEYFVSFDDLRRERFPKLDVVSPEHLFLALCEKIDQKILLQMSAKPEAILDHPVNLNLSVASVIGANFTQFAHAVPANKRSAITLELHCGDILQDFTRTMDAIELLKREGFKVALDSITPDMLPYVQVSAFKVDFLKINVGKDRAGMLNTAQLRQHLQALPLDKVIFFRCDNELALSIGASAGIRLYQGWLVDERAGSDPQL